MKNLFSNMLAVGSALAVASVATAANAATFNVTGSIGSGAGQGTLSGNITIPVGVATNDPIPGSITTGAAGSFNAVTYSGFFALDANTIASPTSLFITFSSNLSALATAPLTTTFNIVPGFFDGFNGTSEIQGQNSRAAQSSTSITAIAVTAVPFEFSPLGLVALGAGYYLVKRNKKANAEIAA